jgi:hexosaminidase
MRKGGFLLFVIVSVCGVLGVLSAVVYVVGVRPSTTSAPKVIPAFRQWTAGVGAAFQWTTGSRLVVEPSAAAILSATPWVLATDLQAMTGRSPAVVSGTATFSRPGDIFLTIQKIETPTHPEGYGLTIGSTLTISARTGDGVFYGTRSVLQLLHQSHTVPPGRAVDWPLSPQRGLSIDVARKYFTIPWLQRRITDLAYLKYNYLRLHLTDDQAFRLESSTALGITAAKHYSKAEIADLVAMAARYHITVIPEIDMPGHLGALLSHPSYTALALDPAHARSALDISKPEARALLRSLVAEYLPLFPGRYFSIGADEYITDYAKYPQLREYARSCNVKATPKDAFYCFTNDMAIFLRQHGKITRIWNDALVYDAHAIALDPTIVVDYWNGVRGEIGQPATQDPDTIAAAGNKVVNASWTATINHTTYTVLYYVLGPKTPKPAPRAMYELWNPTMFDGGWTMTKTDNLVGSQFNIWCDEPAAETEGQVADGIWPNLLTLAQKSWGTPMPTRTYTDFEKTMAAVDSP